MSVTIGIINHNLSRFLPEAIESALGQGQVRVFDDGSTDDSLAICESYGVPVWRNETASGSAVWGWNQLIDSCRTEWLVPLSADDRLKPNACERIASREADWVYGDLDLIDASGNPIGRWGYSTFPATVPACVLHMWRTRTLFPTMLAGFRVSFLRDHNLRAWHFRETQAFADTPTGCSWLACWPRLAYVGEPLFDYRQHEGSETNTTPDRAVMQDALGRYMTARYGEFNRLGG